MPRVIQEWRGNCPQLYRELPGGLGGEVGFYRTIPGRQIPTYSRSRSRFSAVAAPAPAKVVSRILKDLVDTAEAGAEWWWPYPEFDQKIEMRLLHPDRDEELFHADPPEPAGGVLDEPLDGYGQLRALRRARGVPGRRVPLHAYYRMVLGRRAAVPMDAPGGPIAPV
jgi:hypothetical protein